MFPQLKKSSLKKRPKFGILWLFHGIFRNTSCMLFDLKNTYSPYMKKEREQQNMVYLSDLNKTFLLQIPEISHILSWKITKEHRNFLKFGTVETLVVPKPTKILKRSLMNTTFHIKPAKQGNHFALPASKLLYRR